MKPASAFSHLTQPFKASSSSVSMVTLKQDVGENASFFDGFERLFVCV